MFEATRILFVYVETPLHAGTGRGLGGVDLPIQRERVTSYPIVQGSGLKGCLRAATRGTLQEGELDAIFGPERDPSAHAGALAIGDARVLLFPVRSLAGVFAWTTSVHALARFQREAAMAGLPVPWSVPPAPGDGEALTNGTGLKAGDSVVLEEFSFTPKEAALEDIGTWIADNALLPSPQTEGQTDEYRYWREALRTKLCVLPEDAFRDFLQHATEVQTHVRLKQDTKTVEEGPWTEESLPVDTLLYAPLMASRSRSDSLKLTGEEILNKLQGIGLVRLQLGGDETTGQGLVALRFYGGEAK